MLTDVRDRQHLLAMHKKAKKLGLDFNQYNQLKDQITKIELDLRKLRNPLRLRLPPNVTKSETPATPTVAVETPKSPETTKPKE